jgi:hypothetical protein
LRVTERTGYLRGHAIDGGIDRVPGLQAAGGVCRIGVADVVALRATRMLAAVGPAKLVVAEAGKALAGFVGNAG